MPAVNGGRSGDVGKVIVGNGPLFDFRMGVTSINTKLRPIILTYYWSQDWQQPFSSRSFFKSDTNQLVRISCGTGLFWPPDP